MTLQPEISSRSPRSSFLAGLVDRRAVLVVHPEQLLAGGDKPCLQGGRTPDLGDELNSASFDVADQPGRLVRQAARRRSPPPARRFHPAQIALGQHGGYQHHHVALAQQHRNGRLRRDARHLAIDELVDHQIADARHLDGADGGQQGLERSDPWLRA